MAAMCAAEHASLWGRVSLPAWVIFAWESHCHEARPDPVLAVMSQLCTKCVDKLSHRTEGPVCCLSPSSARRAGGELEATQSAGHQPTAGQPMLRGGL